jgi:hypothetical protein
MDARKRAYGGNPRSWVPAFAGTNGDRDLGRFFGSAAMRAPRQQRSKPDRGKPRGDKPPATGNKQLARQVRKILGKHYASKYRMR